MMSLFMDDPYMYYKMMLILRRPEYTIRDIKESEHKKLRLLDTMLLSMIGTHISTQDFVCK